MTEEQIKEHLSRRYVELLANRHGFACNKPDPDNGVDLVVSRVTPYEHRGRRRLLDDGKRIDIQLKATCTSNTMPTEIGFKYDLEAKTYNDLVIRNVPGAIVPFVLILVVLPDNPSEWLQVTADELTLRRSAYWYLPEAGAALTDNLESKRVEIPHDNLLDYHFFVTKYDEYYP